MKTPRLNAVGKIDFEQRERQEFILNRLGKEDWLEVFRLETGPNSTTFWCALVESSHVAAQLEKIDWEFSIGAGRPGHIVYGMNRERIEYFRYGNDDGFQPLVHPRNFRAKKRSFVEISEEFRLLFDLFPSADGSKLSKLHENGMEEDVVFLRDHSAAIKLRYVRQFLAVKDMHLAVFFEMDCEGDRHLSDEELEEFAHEVKTDVVHYNIWAWNKIFGSDDGAPSGSRIMGKKFIAPFVKSECGVFPYNENKPKFAEFLIRVDDDGKQIAFTCNFRKLADDFGKNRDAPDFLTPVFFRREVLHKYYSKPDMYSVEAGYIRCGGQWGLQIDDEHRDFVVVALGDLGKGIPYEEQLYWKSYNVTPEGSYSRGWIQRNMLGLWVGTTHPEFVFKGRFSRFQESWFKKFGWHLFLPLREGDSHLLSTLRIPLNDEQPEFDGQVLALAKLMVDSLNEAEISKLLPTQIADEKGMAKFERFLTKNGIAAESICTFMRRLYGLRHGVGHRKGDSYERAAEFFGVGKQPFKEVFVEILTMATEVLESLERKFLRASDNAD